MSIAASPRLPVSAFLCATLACACRVNESRPAYPASPAGGVVEQYHGVAVPDPFRWLEEPDSPETRRWIEEQNELTFGYLDQIPARERIRARLTELWDFERYELPLQEGGRIFFRKNDGLQNQSVLYVAEGVEGTPRVLLDPNTLSSDGTVALMQVVPSPDGELLAYALSDGGSDWRTWKVRVVDSGTDLPDVVTRNKFGGLDWTADGRGFFYARYDRPPAGVELRAKNPPPDVCFHRLGTDEGEDVLVAGRPAQEGRSQSFSLSEDRGFLYLTVLDVASRKNEVYRQALDPEQGGHVRGEIEALVQGFDGRTFPIGDDGRSLWARTDLGAPRGRIVVIDPSRPERANWRELVPEAAEAIQGADEVGGRLIVTYLQDARSVVRVFDTGGKPLGQVTLPGIGSVAGFRGEHDDSETFFSFESFTAPTAIYRYDVASGASELFRESPLRFDPGRFETEQVFYTSRDGTRIPMFLTHRTGLARDGSSPTFLNGYGGFGISLTPSFSVPNLVWLEMGGLLAVPNLRGGGEYGEDWHEAGTKLQKQNVFDDFIAAAEWLTRNGWTRCERLAIGGGSNGGLLVGACLTQRPDLFGAALPSVGVLDMLRYHRFTIGWAWAGDYGTADDPQQFRSLYAYSPLHNVKSGTDYPATMVTTGDHDDRVVPAHSYKFTAALQGAQQGPEPILIRVETRAGHGAGKPTTMRIEEAADRWAFLVRELGMTY